MFIERAILILLLYVLLINFMHRVHPFSFMFIPKFRVIVEYVGTIKLYPSTKIRVYMPELILFPYIADDGLSQKHPKTGYPARKFPFS